MKDLAQKLGLSEKEWEHLCAVLDREPMAEELQMVSVMWSEHCSYKHSKTFLKKLKSFSSKVLEGPGENAGLIELDEKYALAFKVESHNHPSFVEPFQGAATGVGGILRDIFTMGARPIAMGNYLRFGELHLQNHQYLLQGVVGGISHYGNSIGIPNVAGQIHSDACYNDNILVNVFALGIVEKDKIFRSSTAKPDHSIMVWGAPTGRDGVHGASLLASSEFQEADEESASQKIRVQVGDPFRGKCLMEACLESMQKYPDYLVAIQDMGAAGLTSSTTEIASKSKVGMKIDLDQVPVREEGMEAFELLLSESQERMLAVVAKGSESKFKEILNKWGCEAAVIGETTQECELQFFSQNKKVVGLPVEKLMDPPTPEAVNMVSGTPSTSASTALPEDVRDEWSVLKEILGHSRLASKEKVYERYDWSVGASTAQGPGAEAAVLWMGGVQNKYQGVAFKGACDEKHYRYDAAYGARAAVAESVRALACVGARAVALTDGVNLGSPKNPDVLNSLDQAVAGMNEAMEVFQMSCVSGNVSLYNQTQRDGQSFDIDPSIIVVSVGLVEDVRKSVSASFQQPGNEVWTLEASYHDADLLSGSLYARYFWNETAPASLPYLDLSQEKKLQEALLESHQEGLLESCRDLMDGGLAPALVESCLSAQTSLGFEGDFAKSQRRRDELLFGEAHGRVVVEISPHHRASWMRLAMKHRLETQRLGTISKEPIFRIRPLLNGSLEELSEVWRKGFL